ncbi:hypothetical protein CDD80_2265 [Ophiocordyceps camponoti-rufipedis]|uniref:BTB domain-containing protein n=1 Tax=Ophiocordyceps camponoti-rufipedis TaxID=2004952 RepID=A0A2C5Z843_9HYPO|nr:hypothetical protein CDD80_2265 [Ophiocordyceps camponoti-rufipedis]
MPSNAPSSNSMLLENFGDATFFSNGEEFKVHKTVVCSHSPALRWHFAQASQSSRIDMSDFEPEVVKRLVQFIYTGNYDSLSDASIHDETESENDDSEVTGPLKSTPELHEDMISIGSAFDITGLVAKATDRLNKAFVCGAIKRSWPEGYGGAGKFHPESFETFEQDARSHKMEIMDKNITIEDLKAQKAYWKEKGEECEELHGDNRDDFAELERLLEKRQFALQKSQQEVKRLKDSLSVLSSNSYCTRFASTRHETPGLDHRRRKD